VELDVDFEGVKVMDDGLFKLAVHYSMVHGHGKEAGDLMIERKHEGDLYTTTLKTTAVPFVRPIISTIISNLEIKLESDRKTKLNLVFVSRDFGTQQVNIRKISDKSLNIVVTSKAILVADLTFKVDDLNLNNDDNDDDDDDSDGAKDDYVDDDNDDDDGDDGDDDDDDDDDLIYKVDDLNMNNFDGIFNILVEGTVFTYKRAHAKKIPVRVNFTGSKNKSGRVVRLNIELFNQEWIMLDANIKKTIKGFDAKIKYKFPFLWSIVQGNALVSGDTSVSPHVFILKLNDEMLTRNSPVDIIVHHVIGSSLVIDVKGGTFDGLHLECKHSNNTKNGRDVSLLLKAREVQVLKTTWSTERINNADEFKFILHDTIDVYPGSFPTELFEQYGLQPFKSRTGEFEFYVDKKERNGLLNKFYAKGRVMKDEEKVFGLLVKAIESPYIFELFAPHIFGLNIGKKEMITLPGKNNSIV